MKLIKNNYLKFIYIFLISICFYGANASDKNIEILDELNCECSCIHTICHHGNPDGFDAFDACMSRNGCGGGGGSQELSLQ